MLRSSVFTFFWVSIWGPFRLSVWFLSCSILSSIPTGLVGLAQAETEALKPPVVVNSPPRDEFSFRLFRKLSKVEGAQSWGFSPYSVTQGLGLLALGAKGQTLKQLGKLPEVLPLKKDTSTKVMLANRVWVQVGFPLQESYYSIIDKTYGVRPWIVDFTQAPDFLRDRVNGWIEERTRGKVKGLLQEGNTDSTMRMIFSGALALRAVWANPFDSKTTQEGNFNPLTGDVVKTPFLHRVGNYRYFKGEKFQVLELPYSDGETSMFVFLPESSRGLEEFSQKLGSEEMEHWMAGLATQEVSIALPKLNLDSKVELTEILKSLGITDIFDPEQANFSVMTGKKGLFLSRMDHQISISVSEQGTEAGATSLESVGRNPASEPVSFVADHPFIYVIRNKTLGTPLMMGVVYKP